MSTRWIALAVSLLAASSAWSGDNRKSGPARGITAGEPKAFDSRTLNLMLDTLSNSLGGLNVIDQRALSQALGTIQGSRSQDVTRTFTVQGNPTPEIDTSTSQAASQDSVNGAATSNSTYVNTVIPSVTPTIPWNGNGAAPPSAYTNLQYGMSASDLLSEQVDLTYQIFNLRLLLERSLSDRLLWERRDDKTVGLPRLQTVIGMNVSIDPPRDAENAAAVIEVTLYQKDRHAPQLRPSLVSLMPQEHTYNSAALSSKSNAFGGSAVAKVVQVGFTERRKGQTYYLFRDNDTVSFERQTDPHKGEITFGWVFRPVLGRKSVAPGSRQVFAVVSIPVHDPGSPAKADLDGPIELTADVHAYWKKYDPGSLTTATRNEIRPWDKLGHVFSLGATLAYPPGGETLETGYSVKVPLTSSYLTDLRPRLRAIAWRPVGAKEAVVSIQGENLFQDTRIALGDRILNGPKDGLRLVSDQGLDLTTDMAALAADAAILGRYGPASPLELTDTKKKGLRFTAEWSDPLGGYTELVLHPNFNSAACLEPGDLDDAQLGMPLVFVNGVAIPGPYHLLRRGVGACLDLGARVPVTLTKDLGGIVMMKFPFRGKALEASDRLYNPVTNFTVQVLTPQKDYLLQKIDGAFVPEDGFYWRLIVGSDPPVPLLTSCPTGSASRTLFCLLTERDKLARISFSGASPAATPLPAMQPIVWKPAPQSNHGSRYTKAKYVTPRTPSPPPAPPAVKPGLEIPKTILLQQGSAPAGATQIQWTSTYAINMPGAEPDTPKPAIDSNQKLAVNQHDGVWRSFTGAGLNTVSMVTAGNYQLQTNMSADGKSIAVYIPQELTRNPAMLDLTFLDKQSHQIGIAELQVRKTADSQDANSK